MMKTNAAAACHGQCVHVHPPAREGDPLLPSGCRKTAVGGSEDQVEGISIIIDGPKSSSPRSKGVQSILAAGLLVSIVAFVLSRIVSANLSARRPAVESSQRRPPLRGATKNIGRGVNSWEFKVPLKCEALDGVDFSAARTYVRDVLLDAASDLEPYVDMTDVSAVVAGDPIAEHTSVVFYDTPKTDLLEHDGTSYILRWRRSVNVTDLTFKVRGVSRTEVSSRDVSYCRKHCGEIKLEQELVGTGGLEKMHRTFSLDGVVSSTHGQGCIPTDVPNDIGGWSDLFPGLSQLLLDANVPILPVNGLIVDQRVYSLGMIKFVGAQGGVIKAEASLELWQNGGYPATNPFARDLAADFSFEFQTWGEEKIAHDAYEVCLQFFLQVQDMAYQEWIDNSGVKTKTEYVYDPPLMTPIL